MYAMESQSIHLEYPILQRHGRRRHWLMYQDVFASKNQKTTINFLSKMHRCWENRWGRTQIEQHQMPIISEYCSSYWVTMKRDVSCNYCYE